MVAAKRVRRRGVDLEAGRSGRAGERAKGVRRAGLFQDFRLVRRRRGREGKGVEPRGKIKGERERERMNDTMRRGLKECLSAMRLGAKCKGENRMGVNG